MFVIDIQLVSEKKRTVVFIVRYFMLNLMLHLLRFMFTVSVFKRNPLLFTRVHTQKPLFKGDQTYSEQPIYGLDLGFRGAIQ